ncbi:hypothetical protein SDC9_115592 [bioreactor metagenome]|uniref:Secretion system C-terminal sorting domain-containing protein n=1 Tax=bioreactor metagenome TaxID=1076179 RepID=A0A645BUA0_9ZZZZ
MGAITGTGTQDQDKTVLKWNISGGVVSSIPEKIILSGHYPTSTTSNGMTPQIFPIDATSFYFDGASSYPALYGTNGSLLDGFMNAESVIKPSEGANGVATVKLGNKHFMICGASSVTNSFYLYEMGEGGAFTGMKLISEFPEDGLGTVSNDRNVVLPIVEKVSETLANIYIYAFNNGYAKYELMLNPSSAINNILDENNYIINKNGTIYFKEKSNVEVYSITGHRIISIQDVNSIEAPKNIGFYTIRAVNQAGLTVTKKIIIN